MMINILWSLLVLFFNISNVFSAGGTDSLVFTAGNSPEIYTEYDIAYFSCNSAISRNATFCPEPKGEERRHGHGYDHMAFSCFCRNPMALGSFAMCLVQNNLNTTKVVREFVHRCNQDAEVEMSINDFYSSYENATKYALDPNITPNYNGSEIIDFPIILDRQVLELFYIAYKRFLQNYNDSISYGAIMIGYWGIVLILASVSNLTFFIFPGFVKRFTGCYSNLFRKYFSLAATGNRKRMESQTFFKYFDFFVPSRVETFIIIGFVLVTIGANTNDTLHISNNPLFPSEACELSRYIGDRSGITVGFIVPLLILFGGRNNFLMWLTGWNFQVFMIFHRWIARIVMALIVIHAIAYAVVIVEHPVRYPYQIRAFSGAAVSTIAGCSILFQALLYFRRHWYEIFILLHVFLAMVFVAGAGLHVSRLGYLCFYYAAAGVWGFDRIVRLGRLMVFGFPKAECKLLCNDTIRVTIPKPSHWKPLSGGYIFISFFRPSCFWQSHPFSYVNLDSSNKTITLYCKVKGGITHGLCQYLKSLPDETAMIRVAVEGPYGESSPIAKYDTAILIAGGSGITGTFSKVAGLTSETKTYRRKQYIKLYWVVRDLNSVAWCYPELMKMKDRNIDVILYLTSPSPVTDKYLISLMGSTDSDHDEKKSDLSDGNTKICPISHVIMKSLPNFKFVYGRPHIESIVCEEIRSSNGSIAFETCAPPKMVDEIRYSISNHLDDSNGNRVDFFELLQIWA